MTASVPDIADAAQRLRALDPHSSFIVQAPAGSGKTELLTQRVLVLLAQVAEPEEVMAITFTRKAAAEMRQRVFAAIRSARDEAEPLDAHRRKTWHLACAVLQRSREAGWGLEDNPQRLRMLTIDALCAHIVQQAPLSAGFGGRVQVLEQPELAYREAARAVLALIESGGMLAQPVARVLRHFDNRSRTVEDQLVALLARRDQWLPYTTAGARAERPREALEAAITEVVAATLAEVSAAVPARLRETWLSSAAYASSCLYPAHPQLPLHLLREGHWPDRVEDLEAWQALVDLVLTKDGGWRRAVDSRCGFPAGKSKAEKAERDPPKQAHLALIAALSEQPGLCEQLQSLRRLPQPRYSEAQWEILQALLDTLRLAAAQLRLVFARRGGVDFCEIAMQAVQALGDPEAPSELALKLDYRLQHVLVDEFQDTSTLQWQLLERLIAGWAPGDGRSLFVVGDPMQSIYRFRDADVGLFMEARRHGIGGVRLEPLQLCCNFRSDAALVDWVNTAFSRVLPAVEDRDRGAAAHARAVATRPSGPGPAVSVHAFTAPAPDAEAARVVTLIQETRELEPDASVAVLVRSRGHLEAIVPALRAAKLPYRAVDIEALDARPVIEDLRALTRALLHPADRIAWLAVLRAPWCGLALVDIHALADGLAPAVPLLSAVFDAERAALLSADGQQRLVRLRSVLEPALTHQGRKPLRRWVESVWLALGGPACAQNERDLADAQTFFELLERQTDGPDLADLDALDAALAQLKAHPDTTADTRLSLMTIHKSKGLEFDVVIVPGLGRGTRQDSRPPVTWTTRRGPGGREQLLLAPVHPVGAQSDPLYSWICALQEEKQRHEDARLVYVAATRARRTLHLLGAVEPRADEAPPAPPDRSLLARLWPAVASCFTHPAPPSTSAASPEAESRRPPPIRRLPVDWQAPSLTGSLPTSSLNLSGESIRFDWASETARVVGLVYHRCAQWIAQDGVTSWQPARVPELAERVDELLAAEALPELRRAEAKARVLLALRNTLEDARGRWILQSRPDARSEWALTVLEQGQPRRLVLDRSFTDEQGQRWVVDFKTSVHEGGALELFLQNERERYRRQLESYRAALERLEGRPARVALYLPLIDEPRWRWVELEPSGQ